MKRAPTLNLSDEQKIRLQTLARSRLAQVRLAERARIILLAAEGLGDKAIAAQQGCDRRTVSRWRKRFIERGLEGIECDAPRQPRKRQISIEKIRTVVDKTISEAPPSGKRWSSRSLARAIGISEASIRRIWRSEGIVCGETGNHAARA